MLISHCRSCAPCVPLSRLVCVRRFKVLAGDCGSLPGWTPRLSFWALPGPHEAAHVLLYREPFVDVDTFVDHTLMPAVTGGTASLPSLLCTPVDVLVGRLAAWAGQRLSKAPVVILGGPKVLQDMERGK
jgi:hypothetical protein